MENLFILGIKHSGKTTFARLLAEKLNLPFVDSDDLILKSIAPVSVREFYKQNGEKAFKKVEAESVKNYVSSITRTFVMSLGGGASDNDELIEIVKGNGRLIYLVRPEEEMLAVKIFMEDISKKEIFNLNFFIGKIHNKDCVIVRSGVGKVNAARTTQIMIDNFKIDYVINIGSAGGINPEIKIGDIVVAERLVQYDFDLTGIGDYELRRNL